MRIFISILFSILFIAVSYAQQFTILSWNISNLGKTKTSENIDLIAQIISEADIICIQEVVASHTGSQAVAKIVNILNQKNNIWDYSISDPTQSSTPYLKERYAFIWRKNKFKINRKFELEKIYNKYIEREPYIGSFTIDNFEIKIFNYHAITKNSNPEKEIKYFKEFPKLYGNNSIFLGDFNTSNSNTVFNPMFKLGYKDIFINQKTSLKQKCINHNCLANAYDHIFYPSNKIELLHAKAILFYTEFKHFKQARKISDHIPILASFRIIDNKNAAPIL
jgi:deoxyribonuclease-1-like protein